ncbi:MFS transporter [Streptosporangium sp. CA-135522]|uniref:MFS transporter n=1 Tax=Streptosporangium sp. CA-135522 TaxID=3240072 RepID=UPI003D905BD1
MAASSGTSGVDTLRSVPEARSVRTAATGGGAARWKIWLAAWPVTGVFVLSNMPTPLYPLWKQRMGFSSGTMTIIFACYIVGLLAALMVAGRLSDRIGRKPVLLPGLLLAVAACATFATASSVLELAVARLLTGIAIGITVSVGMAAVVDLGGASWVRQATLAASTAMVLGAGLGPLSAGILSQTLPEPTVAIFLVEIVLLLSAVVAMLCLPLPRPGADANGGWLRLPSVPTRNRVQVALGIAVFAPGITSTSFVLSLGPSLLADLLATHNRLVAGGMAFMMFAAATGVQFAVRRLGVRSILLGGLVSTAASMAALILAVHVSSATLLIVAAVLAGAAQGLGQFGGLSLIGVAVPPHRRAEANAALNVGGYVPAALLPVTAGYLGDAVGMTTSSTIFGAAMIAMAAAGAAFVGIRGREPINTASPE